MRTPPMSAPAPDHRGARPGVGDPSVERLASALRCLLVLVLVAIALRALAWG